ncbi:MAG: glycosyltransferase [Bacteroidia bacterium]|jgi:glycosyltransferase involved in cell wall biosynthesis|nr:glycosyltransferase [Bacteroidia bacterium]
MPKILRIINRFNLGGITYNVSYLSKYLPGEYETMLIGGPEEEGESSSLHITDSLNLKPVIIKDLNREISLINDYKSYTEIKRLIKEFKPDIVHTHASKAGAIGRLAAISCKVPVIVHTFHGHVFHNYFGKLKTAFYLTIERYLAKRSSAIVTNSNLLKKELSESFQITTAEKIHVVPLGFDLAKFQTNQKQKRKDFRSKYKIKEDELVISIIGRLAPIKNHELFFDAIENITKQSSKKIKAIIVGDGETRQYLESYLKNKNLVYCSSADKNCVFNFIGWQKDVDQILAGTDIVALSSKNEGTPVSLIEAQAAGKFIVTTNVGGVKDILHNDCGFVSETDEEFKTLLLKAIEEHDALNQKAKAGIAFANEQFSYKRLVNDMDILYKKLLSRRVL